MKHKDQQLIWEAYLTEFIDDPDTANDILDHYLETPVYYIVTPGEGRVGHFSANDEWPPLDMEDYFYDKPLTLWQIIEKYWGNPKEWMEMQRLSAEGELVNDNYAPAYDIYDDVLGVIFHTDKDKVKAGVDQFLVEEDLEGVNIDEFDEAAVIAAKTRIDSLREI
jgi:hypothetical protein